MLKNYLKTILRSIQRNRSFTLINVIGLSLGLAAFIAITQYVRFETGFDRYHPESQDIFRLGMDVNFGDGELQVPFMGAPAATSIKADFPEVEASTRLSAGFRREYFVKYGDKEFKEEAMTRLYADDNFFEFFGIELIQGNPAEVLNGPNLVVITEAMAEKYFGLNWREQQLLGKNISMDEHPALQISGISENVPDNTHFDYHFLISGQSTEEWKGTFWFSGAVYQYFRMQPDTDIQAFTEKLDQKAPDYLNNDIKQFLGSSYGEFFAEEGKHFRFFYQPIGDIHLNSHFELELAENGDLTYVNVFSIVSVLVLLMAAINFMNLSTVAGLKRHKEVGVRKVLGSLKTQLIFQFLLESVMIVSFSLVLAVTVLQLMAPWLNGSFDREIIPSLASMLDMIVWLIAGAFLLGILSGLYPALILSRIKPTLVLKGFSGKKGVGFFRNALIIFQFTVSLLLIIGMTGIHQQLEHLRSRDLGYDKDQVMIIEDVNVLGDQVEAFRTRLLQNASISQATISGFIPIGSTEYGIFGLNSLDDEEDLTQRFRGASVDEHYLETYGLELVSGRGFSADFGEESRNIIVNEAFVRTWGWDKEELLGKRFLDVGDRNEYQVIGVIKDFQVFNMNSDNQPLVLAYGVDNQAISLRLNANRFEAARDFAADSWTEFTDKPFSYTMADARFETIFANERRASSLFAIFSALAVAIGALGLLGVASYVIVRRSKEVGIRKVLGASVTQLFTILSKDFMLLVLIAGVLAIPLAWYFLGDWLSQYAYQMALQWWLFVIPLFLLGFMAFSIIAVQIWKVAIINPIKSLRYE